MRKEFTTEAEKALNKAAKFAMKMGQSIVGSEHMLYGLSAAPGVASKILKDNGLDKESLEYEIKAYCGVGDTVVMERSDCETSPKLEELLMKSAEEAEHMEEYRVGTEHMLLAILKDISSVAYRIILASGANIQKIYMDTTNTMGIDPAIAKNELIASRSKKEKGRSATPVLDQFARDLNEYAKEGKLDPVFDRDEEIDSMIRILSRRTKNNPCLIGEPGVGKTALAEGLAIEIVEGRVPDTLSGKRILTLDLSGMVAGSKYRGEFEERIKRAIKETVADGNILLFIDELHTVIGAGGAEGSIDASNILKPALARGELQVIGATTREEYRKHIEKDAALERRFQPVVIEEPTPAQTVNMLKGLRGRYEDYHKVTITDEAIDVAVKLSVRYINDRYLPDKAIDLIDEAAAKYRLQTVYRTSEESLEYTKQREDLYDQKEQALIDGDLDRARQIAVLERELEEEHKEQEKKNKKKVKSTDNQILAHHVEEVEAQWTHITVQKMQKEEAERLVHLPDI